MKKFIKFFVKMILPFVNGNSLKITKEMAEKDIRKIYIKKELFKKSDIQNLESDENIDLSIIVPVYNSEKFLKRCIDSIINQKTKYYFEIIVINDGSTDSSLKILKEYQKRHNFFHLIDQKNRGISGARNEGLNNAKGKYVGFIDNDDYISEDYVETLLDRAYKNNADIVKCNHVNFSELSGKTINRCVHEDASIWGYMGEEILKFEGTIWGGIICKELWNDFRFPLNYWYEDIITRLIVMRKCKRFEYIDKDLYFYSVHLDSASKTIWNRKDIRCLDQYFLLEKLMEYSDKNNLPRDSGLYKIVLYELGPMLWQRTKELNEKIRKQIFILACDFIKKYKVNCDLKWQEKYWEKSFIRKDYLLWKLVGRVI